MEAKSTDKTAIADLVAKYGSSSATAWLEFQRYKLWRPSEPIPESSFTPVQGYMERDPYIFAWGNPLVSDPAALENVARQFVQFCESGGKRPVWACVDRDLEEVLASPEFGWSTVSCIYEDVVDPAHVIELTSPEAKGKEGQHVIKDLKKNLGRAEKYHVRVKEMMSLDWTEEDMRAVEKGIKEWKENKSGVQIASTTMEPWLDSEHRRYWLARQEDEDEIVGILILTPIQSSSWQIKNAVSFPSAPKGTSEVLIYTALKDLHEEQLKAEANGTKIPHPAHGNIDTTPIQPLTKDASTASIASESASSVSTPGISDAESNEDPIAKDGTSTNGHPPSSDKQQTGNAPEAMKTHHRDEDRVTVTFGISASPEFQPIRNLGGWKVKALSKTYKKVASGAKLVQRGEFRSKFDSEGDPMYVCYPPNGFGLEGVNALLKSLRK